MPVRDMDLDVPIADARRLEVVVDGLPLQGGAQLAMDTLVCALHADGRPRLDAAKHDGVALKVARRKKNPLSTRIGWSPQPSQVGGSGCRDGRWSEEKSFPEPVGKCTCEVSDHRHAGLSE